MEEADNERRGRQPGKSVKTDIHLGSWYREERVFSLILCIQSLSSLCSSAEDTLQNLMGDIVLCLLLIKQVILIRHQGWESKDSNESSCQSKLWYNPQTD